MENGQFVRGTVTPYLAAKCVNSPKWSTMVQNGPMWSIMYQNSPILPKLVNLGDQYGLKMVRNHQKWSEMAQIGN